MKKTILYLILGLLMGSSLAVIGQKMDMIGKNDKIPSGNDITLTMNYGGLTYLEAQKELDYISWNSVSSEQTTKIYMAQRKCLMTHNIDCLTQMANACENIITKNNI